MKRPPLLHPHICKNRALCRMTLGRLTQLAMILLMFVTPLSAEVLADQTPTVSERTSEQWPEAQSLSGPDFKSINAQRIACFDRLWSSYQEDVWFYGTNGQRIVPKPVIDWLVVRLLDATESSSTEAPDNISMMDSNIQPASFESFNTRYGEYFSHFLRDPELAPAMAAFRLRRDMPREVFQTLMTRLQQDPQIMYAHPAWKIADQLYAPLERIEVIWKTAASAQQRHAVRQAVGAMESEDISSSNHEKLTIVPCQQSVWQTANLLAEDIRVAQAWPELMPLVPPVGVHFSLAMNGATAGTAIPFTFEIQFTDKVKIESSTIANLNLKPGGIFHNLYDIHYDVPLSAIDLNHSPIRITGQIKIYATGEYSIPGVPIYYTDSDMPKSKVQLIKTAEVPVRIAAMIPENQAGFDLQVGEPDPVPEIDTSDMTSAKRRFTILMLSGVVLIGLAWAAFMILLRSRRQQTVQPQNHALNDRYAATVAAIEAARQRKGLPEIAALGLALKNYLAEIAGLDLDQRGGSHSAFFRRVEPALPGTCRASAAEVLSAIDHALARGDQTVIPDDLVEKSAKLTEALRVYAETLQNVS